jgi:acetyl esterase/lipase
MSRFLIITFAFWIACTSFAQVDEAWVPETIGQGAFKLRSDRSLTYKVVDKEGVATGLKLEVFLPKCHQPTDRRPAAVFFHGGGWYGGTPDHMYPQCRYLALRGMVTISVQYRTIKAFGTSPKECVKDGKSAMRWVRSHAAGLGIDPSKIVAGGGSAGGHIAAATALVAAFDEAGEDRTVSCLPQALVLFNPVFDNGPNGFAHGLVRDYWKAISPIDHIDVNTPPTFVVLGTEDEYVPAETGRRFERLMQANGRRCDLHLYEGKPHGFFNIWVDRTVLADTLIRMDRFLGSLGYLEGAPTLSLEAVVSSATNR